MIVYTHQVYIIQGRNKERKKEKERKSIAVSKERNGIIVKAVHCMDREGKKVA
jgi:hypothetical protein